MPNFNMEDPTEQEKVRRGPHTYLPTAGKHGAYVPNDGLNGHPAPYDREKNEYPKMMAKLPQPQFKDFRERNGVAIPGDIALANFQIAMQEWDRTMTASIVHSKAEEARWLRENSSAA